MTSVCRFIELVKRMYTALWHLFLLQVIRKDTLYILQVIINITCAFILKVFKPPIICLNADKCRKPKKKERLCLILL